MPDFTPTQYEAREGRDDYIARPRGGKIEVLRVNRRTNEQVSLGPVDDIAAANALKDQDQAERSSADMTYIVRPEAPDRWVVERQALVKFRFPESAEPLGVFPTRDEAVAVLPAGLVLSKSGDDGAASYRTAPDVVGRGPAGQSGKAAR